MPGDTTRDTTRRQPPTLRSRPTADQAARRRSTTVGAIAGAMSALAFTVLHGALILYIWDRAAAMMIAGALCGSFLARSYTTARHTPSATSWLAYNGLHAALLLALGVASLILLEPIASMDTLTASPEPLGDLVPSALPLMTGAAVVGTAVTWATSGRTRALLPSAFTTQLLLVVLVGHNFAILGLVELPNARAALGSFSGATVFLATSFALAYLLLNAIAARIAT